MISITNAGRGAGKTYQLIQWAKEDPNRRIVGFGALRQQMDEAGIGDQYIHMTDANRQLQGRHDITGVGFDNFGIPLEDMLHRYFGVHPRTETILSMAVAERTLPYTQPDRLTVGTRVMVTESTSVFDGRRGTVIHLAPFSDWDYLIQFDTGAKFPFYHDELSEDPQDTLF